MYVDYIECESASKLEDYEELDTINNNDLYRAKEYVDIN